MNGCTWRGLPTKYGRWHTVYTRMSRWTRAGVLDHVFEELQMLNLLRVKLELVSLDSTFTRYDKADVRFSAFLTVAFIADLLR